MLRGAPARPRGEEAHGVTADGDPTANQRCLRDGGRPQHRVGGHNRGVGRNGSYECGLSLWLWLLHRFCQGACEAFAGLRPPQRRAGGLLRHLRLARHRNACAGRGDGTAERKLLPWPDVERWRRRASAPTSRRHVVVRYRSICKRHKRAASETRATRGASHTHVHVLSRCVSQPEAVKEENNNPGRDGRTARRHHTGILKKERKKEFGQPKGGMGGRHGAATTQGF